MYWWFRIIVHSFTVNLDCARCCNQSCRALCKHQLAVGYSSVSITLITVILAYHIVQWLLPNKLWKVPKLILEFMELNNKEAVENLTNDLTESVNLDELHKLLLDDITLLTCTVVRALYMPVFILLQMCTNVIFCTSPFVTRGSLCFISDNFCTW